MSEKKNQSSAHARQIKSFPPPKYHGLVVGMSKLEGISKSEVVCIALKQYFDSMPERDRARLMSVSKQGSKHSY
jgi:hypothetical protein